MSLAFHLLVVTRKYSNVYAYVVFMGDNKVLPNTTIWNGDIILLNHFQGIVNIYLCDDLFS